MANRHRKRRRLATRIKRRAPGTPPGSLTVDPNAPRPVVRVFAYGKDEYKEQRIDDLQQLRSFVGRWPVTWVIIEGLGDAGVLAEIGRIFDFHPLAMEDVANTLQRAKIDDYGKYLFLEARIVELKERLESQQISVFLGPNYVVSFQEHEGKCLDPLKERLRKNQGRIRELGPDYLSYCILDGVVDGYFPVLDEYAERLEVLDERVINGNPRENMTRIHDMRVDLLLLRRAIWPHREMINSLVRDPHPLISDDTRLYLRDCLDHIVTIVELTESYREMCSDLRDYALSAVSNRLNEIMKVLTVIATIFMPLSFIAGVYGMNFDTSSPWNMPELRWPFGYLMSLGLMATVAFGLLAYFWRRGWLGSAIGAPGDAANGSPGENGGSNTPVPHGQQQDRSPHAGDRKDRQQLDEREAGPGTPA